MSFLNHKHSEKSKIKIGLSSLGKLRTAETKKNISLSLKGIPKTFEHRKHLSEANIGKHHSEETKKKLSIKGKGNKSRTGQHWKISEEHKNKIRLKIKGIKRSNETKQKNREWHINHPNTQFKDTNIELKVETELQRRGINYQKQVPLCKIAIVDFYLPEYRIIIQCDGDYWHNYPKGTERDKKQDLILTFNGFNVYRFWERDIKKSVSECINKIFNIKINE